jgi:uncharacterized membrane protein YphA (DoxX/SURF4 family)
MHYFCGTQLQVCMSISSKLDQLHSRVRANRWLRYFAVFNRIALAAGFIPSGFMKIMGERFTVLSVNHPMGNYLEALHHTGYYYTFIGVAQVTAAILLLIPRTALLGALLYLPIILNICILSLAVRFDGSLITSPLMVLADLYLLCWDYNKLKYILPFTQPAAVDAPSPPILNNKFPKLFFAGVATAFALVVAMTSAYDVKPRNTLSECRSQFTGTNRTKAGYEFCDCIHKQGQRLDKCLEAYEKAPNDASGSRNQPR